MTSTSTIDIIGSAKYISLTTYRKDGTPVATPVWLAREGSTVRVVTDPASGKAKRLRNNARVLVSPCDARGRVEPEAISVAGSVAFQDDADTQATMALITRKYGLMGRIMTRMNERRARKAGGSAAHVGLTITLDQ
jgi:PPOX class probable F420-dependent enzyme